MIKLEIEIKVPDSKIKEIIERDMVILIDSREKENNHITGWFDYIKQPYEVCKLEFADYSYKMKANEFWDKDIYFTNKLLIERKNSLAELSGNFADGRTRFENELGEIFEKQLNFHLIVEGNSLSDLLIGDFGTSYNKNAFIGSFFSFADRYNFSSIFISKMYTAQVIFNLCKYNFKNHLK